MCRRHTGAPVTLLAAFPAECVSFEGELSFLQSSEMAKRGFCAQCGTPLSWHGHEWGLDVIAIHISTFADPAAFPPTEHWHIDSAIPWLEIKDDLPRYAGVDAT